MLRNTIQLLFLILCLGNLSSCSSSCYYPMVDIMRMKTVQEKNAELFETELEGWVQLPPKVQNGAFIIKWVLSEEGVTESTITYTSALFSNTSSIGSQDTNNVKMESFVNGQAKLSEFVKNLDQSFNIVEELENEVICSCTNNDETNFIYRIVLKHNELIIIEYAQKSELQEDQVNNWITNLKKFDVCKNISFMFVN